MKFNLILSALACTLLAGTSGAQTWTELISEAEILNATGGSDIDTAEIASDGAGKFVVVDRDDVSATVVEKIVLVDTALTPGSQATLLANETTIAAAVDAVNGTAAYSAAPVAVQGVGFNNAGYIIAFVDDGTNDAALLAIDPAGPTINVLSTNLSAVSTSPVEGGTGMFMDGDIAYLLVDSGFGSAVGDALLSVDTSTIVNDGSATVTTVISGSDLHTAAGDTEANYRHGTGTKLSANEILLVNGDSGSSNDAVILVTLGSPATASLFLDPAAVRTALSTTSIGFTSVAVGSNGWIHFGNAFGNGASDDSIVTIKNVTSPTTFDASVNFEADIASDTGGSSIIFDDNNLIYDASTDSIVLYQGSFPEGVYRVPASTLPVELDAFMVE